MCGVCVFVRIFYVYRAFDRKWPLLTCFGAFLSCFRGVLGPKWHENGQNVLVLCSNVLVACSCVLVACSCVLACVGGGLGVYLGCWRDKIVMYIAKRGVLGTLYSGLWHLNTWGPPDTLGRRNAGFMLFWMLFCCVYRISWRFGTVL